MSEYVPIPRDKAKLALATCLQDPSLARYYENAPVGARPYIALEFYLSVYGKEVGEELAASYYEEIEADLTTPDIAYLLKHEQDPNVKDHLIDLMTRSTPKKKMTLRRVSEMRPQGNPPVPEGGPRAVAAADGVEAIPPAMQLHTAERHGARTQQEQAHIQESVAAVEARWRAEASQARTQSLVHGAKSLLSMLFWLLILVALGWYGYGKFFQKRDLAAEPDSVIGRSPASAAERPVPRTNVAEDKERQAKEQTLAEARRREKAAAEQARKEAEAARQAERQKDEEVRRTARARKENYDHLLRKLGTATMDYWKNAPKDRRPGKASTPLTFLCLVPVTGESVPAALLELFCEPDKPMAVKRLSPDADPVELKTDAFNQMIAHTPYLVMCENTVYFCSQGKSATNLAVPLRGEPLNPSKETFGALYETMERLHFRRPALSWQVLLLLKDADEPTTICTAAYGEDISRDRFFSQVEKMFNDRASARTRRKAVKEASRKAGRKRTVVLYDGNAIRRTIDGVTQVPRSFYYNSSNRHKYYVYSHAYEDEVRKEEQARARWQKLYDEARRQEAAEQEVERAKTTTVSVSVDAQEVEDALNTGKVIIRPVE